MQIDEQDLALFKKLGVKESASLALIIPKNFSDYRLSEAPIQGFAAMRVKILSFKSFGNKAFLIAFCEKWGLNINITLFHPNKWHFAVFKVGKELDIYGRLGIYNDSWQLNNPKIIKEGGIKAHYKISKIADEKIQELIKKYVNEKNLKESLLASEYIDFLLALHDYTKPLQLSEEEKLAKLQYIELFLYLKKLRLKKKTFKAPKISLKEPSAWITTLPFKLSADQISAIYDIRKDLLSKKAARRVVMGDVSCGKSVVLFSAALMVHPKRAILMAPTSILAAQLYTEAKRLLPDFMNIMLLKAGDKKSDLSKAHFIISTHALMYRENLNAVLVMIDEQHRFGSRQRQLLNELNKDDLSAPHIIQFSATPIPRTLSMIQSELLSFSYIKTMPFKKDIQTICMKDAGFKPMCEVIKAEVAKGNQAIIVYTLVNESEKNRYKGLEEAKNYWYTHFDAVYHTHGKDKEKEKILEEFKQKGSLLLTTTIVEVGISLPRLTVLVIVGAEKMGLATLHQLRGRIGRAGLKSYCFLYTKDEEIPKRLEEFSKSLDGFKIAELDLKNRSSGDVVDGSKQSGEHFKYFSPLKSESLIAKVKNELDKLKI